MERQFIPYHKIGSKKVIVVDGLHPQNLVLSHWKGANTNKAIYADTSGEIVLNAIEKNIDGIDCPLISATHFDIDGFVGVYALMEPELALKYKNVLTAMATIGDFREYNPKITEHDLALKLCCWMNKVEKKIFYRPFGEKEEIERCVEKFNYFVNKFTAVLKNINDYKKDWELEYNQVKEGLKQVISINQKPELGLIIKNLEKPSHYYALFSETNEYDIVLSIYNENRYELEMKYTTWVDIVSRPTLPRIDLTELCNLLNQIEKSNYKWKCDKITDTGPILRLENGKLSKAERFANPFERDIYNSSISSQDFTKIIIDFLTEKYKNISSKNFWTWSEMKEF